MNARAQYSLRAPLAALMALVCAWTLSAAPKGPEPIRTLRFVYWDNGLPTEKETIFAAKTAFEKEHRNVQVSVQVQPWADAELLMRIWTGGATKAPPDVIVVRERWLARHEDALLSLDDHIPPRTQARFILAPLERGRLNGHLLGMPWMVTTRALFYRTDLFEQAGLEPPASLRGLRETARRLARPPELHGLGLACQPGEDAQDMFLIFALGHNAQLTDEDGALRLDDEGACRGLEYMAELVAEKGLTQPETLYWPREEIERQFAEGKLAMVIARPGFVLDLDLNHPELKYGTARLPTRAEHFAYMSADYLCALKSTAHPKLAVELMMALRDEKYSERWRMIGCLPVHKRAVREAYASKDEKLKPFLDYLESARSVPARGWDEAGHWVNTALVLGLTGRKAPQEALQAAQQALEQQAAKSTATATE